MNWHDGLVLIWQLHGYRFKPWRTYITLYIFGIFGFSLNMERWKENPKWVGSQRRLDRQL